MKKNRLLKGTVMVCLLGLGGGMGAQATEPVAKVIKIKNKVLINSGRDYAGAQPGQALEKGQRVLTLEESSATVEYRNGCRLELGSNSLLTVADQAQCLQGGTVGAAASGGGASADTAAEPAVAGIPVGLMGAAAAVAATVTAAATSDNSDNQPLSAE